MEAFYYSRMTKTQQSAYKAMKTGLTSLLPAFAVPRLGGNELQDIFFELRLDCPEIFYAAGFRYRFYKDAAHVEIIPEYLFDKKKIKEHQKAMTSRIARLLRTVNSGKEWEQELFVHDFICTSVRYDKLKKPYSHEIIGPLGQGVGVCEGIAKTVKLLCDKLGLWCIIAVSEANPDKGIKYRHAWNIVRIGGSYYHLDVTFDNNLGEDGVIRYDYFNLSDQQFFRDHEPVIYGKPQCSDNEHYYYREKKLSFTKMEEVRKRAQQTARKGKPLVFHWRGGHLTREVMAELMKTLNEAAAIKGKQAVVRLNYSQAVLAVKFAVNQEEELLLVEANEVC